MQSSPLTWIIAGCALIFTVVSFWWLNERPGKLKVFAVTTFGGFIRLDGLRLQLPIVIHNTGAKPYVIRHLQLRATDADSKVFHMEAQSFQKTLDATDESFEDFAHAYVIPGRSVVTRYVRFTTEELPHLIPGQSSEFVLRALLDEREHWTGLKVLSIHTGILTNKFITMSNHPGHWKKDTQANGLEHQLRLMFEKGYRKYPQPDKPSHLL